MNFRKNSIVFIATGGYIGYIPWAPGTFGSLWGLFFGYLFSRLPFYLNFVCLAGFALFAVWVADQAQKIIQQKDPGCIVIDEAVGLVIGLFGLTLNVYTVIIGFALFRLFDILKPPPVGWLDKKVSGGIGIVLDDVAAGIYTFLILRVGLLFFAYN